MSDATASAVSSLGARVTARFSLRDPISRLSLATFLLGLTIYSPILTLFYTGRGLSLFQILSLEAFNSAIVTLSEVPTGVFGDRIGLKRTVLLGHLLRGSWILVLMASQDYWMFLAGYAFLGFSIAFISGALEAWVHELMIERDETDKATRAQGNIWAAGLLGRIVSALLAIVVVQSMKEGYFLLALGLSAAAFFLSAALIATVRDVPKMTQAAEQSSFALIGDGLRLIRHNPKLRRIVALTVLTNPFQYALLFLYQPYFQASNTPLALFGLAAATGAGLGALASRFAYRLEEYVGSRNVFLVSSVAPPLIYLLMAAIFRPYLAALFYVLAFGLMQMREPLIRAMRNAHIGSHNRATAISLMSMLVSVWTLAGKLALGWIADIELSYAFVAMALPALIAALLIRLSDDDLHPTVPID